MDIDEYVDDSLTSEATKAKQQKPKEKKVKNKVEPEDHELIRKRYILDSVALLDELESYIGEKITVAQIRNMKKEKLESYFMLYQQKYGQEITNDTMSSLVEMTVKGLSFAVEIDNEEDLKNDILNNKQLRRTIGKQAAEIAEKYGDGVAIFRVIFDVCKHISFSPKNVLPSAGTLLAEKENVLA